MKLGFNVLCYHYLRKNNDPFPRLFGTKIKDFNDHITLMKKKFNIVTLQEINQFYYKNIPIEKGLLFSFDDGLSDQFEAAKILEENKISGVFFIPTCILTEDIPANPIIIHYAIALHGLKNFKKKVLPIIEEKFPEQITFFKEIFTNDRIEESITKIKNIFHYFLDPSISRNILIEIYERLVKTEGLKIEDLHLTKNQIKKIVQMGHSIGTHSHSHISIGRHGINNDYILTELINPKKILEQNFNTEIISMSYPFGEKKDCLTSKYLFEKTKSYKLAFTIENKFNSEESSPLEIGRYMVHSTDNVEKLYKNLNFYKI